MIKSISRLLSQARKRNDASNRTEFLQSIAEKRRKLDVDEGAAQVPTTGAGVEAGNSADAIASAGDFMPSSCARVDARPQNRDVQMKYDIAKNEDGPLKRTMKAAPDDQAAAATEKSSVSQSPRAVQTEPGRGGGNVDTKPEVTAERHSGLVERFTNIEAHLAVRYGECM